MKPNTILVQFDIDAPVTPILRVALGLAEKLDADVVGFAAADPRLLVIGDMDGQASAESMRVQIDAIETRMKELEEEFWDHCRDGQNAEWCSVIGNPTGSLALHARSADLILTRSARPGIAPDRHRTVDHGSLILSAGRPVLVASKALTPIQADRVLVAWKDTREARRAVSDAMPFLTAAESILVVTAADGKEPNCRESAEAVARFLGKHGAKARSDVVEVDGSDTGEALIQLAEQVGADLFVSGGYGHGRFREWAFGGVTRSLLNDCSMNWLVAN